MTLDEYMKNPKPYALWPLSSGDFRDLLDEAIGRMSDTHLRLTSVLCDPEGRVCCHGSDEDRRIIQDALGKLLPKESQ